MRLEPNGDLGLPAALPGFLVQVFLSALREENVDVGALVPSEPEASSLGMATADFRSLLEAACRIAQNPHLGLLIGHRTTEANLNYLGPVITATASLRTLAAYMSDIQLALFGERCWAFGEDDGECATYSPTSEFSSRPLTELMLALAFRCAQRFVGEPRNSELAALFAFERPDDLSAYEHVFGGRAVFGAARSAIRIPHSLLDAERPGTDPVLATMLCEVVKERFPAALPQSWATRVTNLLREQNQLAHVDIESVAARWQITGRSLRRRLTNEGVRFNDVLNRVRFERAGQLLAHGNTPIARLAASLGYSDSSAFQRAFKRWAAIGPAEYRTRERTRRRSAQH